MDWLCRWRWHLYIVSNEFPEQSFAFEFHDLGQLADRPIAAIPLVFDLPMFKGGPLLGHQARLAVFCFEIQYFPQSSATPAENSCW